MMMTYLNPSAMKSQNRALGAIRRVRALARMGHPVTEVATYADVPDDVIRDLTDNPRARDAYRYAHFPEDWWYGIAITFDDLAMRSGSCPGTRAAAEAAKWPPPLAWDDEVLDDPNGRPNTTGLVHDESGRGRLPHLELDEVAVWRRIHGDTTVKMRPPDWAEAVAILHRQGLNDAQIADRLCTWRRSVQRSRKALGLPENSDPAAVNYDGTFTNRAPDSPTRGRGRRAA